VSRDPGVVALADRLPAELAAQARAAAAWPNASDVVAGARGLALRLGYGLAASLLDEHAAATQDQRDALVARLWRQQRLNGRYIAIDATVLASRGF
jgi:acyl-CoA dehydrogenase